ncbi:glycerophosphodiester phosphodiesterase [Clostridium carnis]
MKKTDINLIKRTYENFMFNYKAIMFFEILYKLLAMFIFIPINYFILNKFMGKIGVYNITNKDLLRLGLTFHGIIYLSLIVIISFLVIFIEIGILTYIANKSHKNEKVNLINATINSIKIVPKTVSIYMVFWIFISGIVGPLTGIGLYSSLIRKLTIPSFIKIELLKSIGGTILLIAGIILIVIILLRWILSIPTIIIEDVNLKQAFKNSVKIYKASKFKILGYIISWVLINQLIVVTFVVGFMLTGEILIALLNENSILSLILMISYSVVFFIIYIVISIINLPLFISFLVELYYRYRCYNVSERNFTSYKDLNEKKIFKFLNRNKNKFTIAVITTFCIVVSGMGLTAVFDKVVSKEPHITAHRGSSLMAPENSISSVKLAIEEKADYAEIDVMTTRENKVVLFHDNTLKRIDGTSRSIKYMTLDEVRTVDNGSYFSENFSNEKIPTLEEILILAKGKIKLNIELKPMKEEDSLAKEVVSLIEKYEMDKEVVISSLDYKSIQEVKKYNPLIKVGYILTFGVGDFTELNVDFISVEYQMLKKELVYAMHALGKEVHVWTINDSTMAEDAIKLGVDNIITDSVETIKFVSKDLKEDNEIDYLTWLYECMNSIIKYVKI